MTAPASIVGTLRTILDAASVPPTDSGLPTHANFRSVLEQYQSSRELDSNSDDAQADSQQKPKDSDPTVAVAIPQPVTTAVETPRPILPLAMSITLRQDNTASPEDETALQDTIVTATQDSIAAANPSPESSKLADTVPALATSPSILGASDAPQPKETAALRAESKDRVPSQKVAASLAPTALDDPSTPILPAAHEARSAAYQYHLSEEGVPEPIAKNRSSQEQQKVSDPVQNFIAPLASTASDDSSTPTLPATSSTTLAQGNAVVQIGSTVNQTPEAVSASSEDRTTSILANSRYAAYQYHSSHEGVPVTIAKNRSSQEQQKVSDPAQNFSAPLASTAPADSSTPILPVTSSTTLEPAGTVVQNSFTFSEVHKTVSASTSDHGVAYQYSSSSEKPAETVVISRASTQPQRASDSTRTVTTPIPVADMVGTQPPVHLPAASDAPRQEGSATASSSPTQQDSSGASGADLKIVVPPALDQAEGSATAPPQGSIAFAARLTPTEEPTSLTAAPDGNSLADPQPRTQTSFQTSTPVTVKQIASEADLPADTRGGEGGSQSEKDKAGDRFAKLDTPLPPTHAAAPDPTAAPTNSPVSSAPLSSAARMDQILEPPPTAHSTNHDITIRIPDSTDQGTAVRFVERAGEVHVSVRTGDAEMAQSLRGGLNDLVNRLEDGGIRTQVWQPGSDAATSQNDSHQSFADPDGSNGRQHSSGSNSEQESKQQNRPRWVEELEGSIGNPNFKETTQLLWQA